MIGIRYLLVVVFFILAFSGYAQEPGNRDVLFQTSTIDALLEGVYDGEVTFGELKKHGDLGIGTFNGLDGEMIGLDGEFYQIKIDGKAYPVSSAQKTPFAVVTFFDSDDKILLNEINSLKELEENLDSLLPTKNIFYAIRIDGVFPYIKARSVPEQFRPYLPLVEAVKNQVVFEFFNEEGTIVGFRCPDYVKGINVVGYHFHFITKDKSSGGHVLDCQIQSTMAKIDETTRFFMVLPQTDDFGGVDLTEDKGEELERIER